jgi:YcaO-like protein with predicted kinase domain
MTRAQERFKSAEVLCKLSYDYLFDNFGITRVSDLTGLDTIGVPVWSSTRPIAHTITFSGGKNLNPILAKAGAIAEGIELSIFEKYHEPVTQAFYPPEVLENLPVRKGFEVGEGHRFPADFVTHYTSGAEVLFPSDLIWLHVRKELSAFQRNSNGQAIGSSMEDAITQGIYECVERDAMTIRHSAQDEFGVMPQRIDLGNAVGPVKTLIDICSKAGLKIYAFLLTFDILVPSVKVFLVDPSESFLPTAGMGTSIWDSVAIERAILEAIQGRLVYISGGRDDIYLSDFYRAKAAEQRKMCRLFDTAPCQKFPHWAVDDLETRDELDILLEMIGSWKDRVLVKEIEGEFPAAKVFIPGLETVITEDWQPGRWKEVRKRYGKDFDICRANSLRDRAGAVTR